MMLENIKPLSFVDTHHHDVYTTAALVVLTPPTLPQQQQSSSLPLNDRVRQLQLHPSGGASTSLSSVPSTPTTPTTPMIKQQPSTPLTPSAAATRILLNSPLNSSSDTHHNAVAAAAAAAVQSPVSTSVQIAEKLGLKIKPVPCNLNLQGSTHSSSVSSSVVDEPATPVVDVKPTLPPIETTNKQV